MQAVLDEELDDDLFGLDLGGQAPKAPFIRIGRCADAELIAELLGQCFLHPERRGVVHAGMAFGQAHGGAEVFFRKRLHADQQSAAVAFAAGPPLDVIMEFPPSAKIEITDTKVRTVADGKRFLQSRQQRLVDVVKDTWHESGVLSLCVFCGVQRHGGRPSRLLSLCSTQLRQGIEARITGEKQEIVLLHQSGYPDVSGRYGRTLLT